MGLYERGAATAVRLLEKHGQSVTLTYPAGGTYDPATGLTPAGSTTKTVRALVDRYEAKEVDGSLIRASDRKLTLSPKDTGGADYPTPPPGTLVDFATGKMRLQTLEPYAPGGPVLYLIGNLRGGPG